MAGGGRLSGTLVRLKSLPLPLFPDLSSLIVFVYPYRESGIPLGTIVGKISGMEHLPETKFRDEVETDSGTPCLLCGEIRRCRLTGRVLALVSVVGSARRDASWHPG